MATGTIKGSLDITYFDVAFDVSNIAAHSSSFQSISSLVPSGYMPIGAYVIGTSGGWTFFTPSINTSYVFAYNNSVNAQTAKFTARVFCVRL
jgi:hypothetical protein